MLMTSTRQVLGPRRYTWRVLQMMLETGEFGEMTKEEVMSHKNEVEAELRYMCADILDLIHSYLIPHAATPEARVRYHKLEADVYRYICEYASGDERAKSLEGARASYAAAAAIAEVHLSPSHPTRLDLARVVSVFYYEIVDCPLRACEVANLAFQEALAEMQEKGFDSSGLHDPPRGSTAVASTTPRGPRALSQCSSSATTS
mmetsp:Transcript_39475/g.125978  ORF Transcript_39475/g.125978 Transcript_39475/m.125978 type:complete len:203 (+) Transcript_39475:2-610(+)